MSFSEGHGSPPHFAAAIHDRHLARNGPELSLMLNSTNSTLPWGLVIRILYGVLSSLNSHRKTYLSSYIDRLTLLDDDRQAADFTTIEQYASNDSFHVSFSFAHIKV